MPASFASCAPSNGWRIPSVCAPSDSMRIAVTGWSGSSFERCLLGRRLGAGLGSGRASREVDRSGEGIADRSAPARVEIVDRVAHDLPVARERCDHLRLRRERDDADAIAIRKLVEEPPHGLLCRPHPCGRHVLREHRPRAVDREDHVRVLAVRCDSHLGSGESEERGGQRQEEEGGRDPAPPCAALVDDRSEDVEVRVADGVPRPPALEHDVRARRRAARLRAAAASGATGSSRL